MIGLRRYAKRRPVPPFGNFASMVNVTARNLDRPFAELAPAIGKRARAAKSGLGGTKNVLPMNAARKALGRRRFDAALSAKIPSIGASAPNIGIIDGGRLAFADLRAEGAFVLASIKNRRALRLTFSNFGDRVAFAFLGSYSPEDWTTVGEIVAGMEVRRFFRRDKTPG